MAINVTPFVGTDNFNMETFNNMISQINSGVNSEISDVLAQLGTKAKIQTGSYVGTGTYGADNPCSLTFDFEPKFLLFFNQEIIQDYPSGETPIPPIDKAWSLMAEGVWANNILNIYYSYTYRERYIVNKIVWGKTVTWYSVNLQQTGSGVIENDNGIDATAQFNRSGIIYKYVAIG